MSVARLTPLHRKRARQAVRRGADRGDGAVPIEGKSEAACDGTDSDGSRLSCDMAQPCCRVTDSTDPSSPSRVSDSVEDEGESDVVDYSTLLADQQQHWRVAGAFQVALWYVLHYAGHALPPAHLLLARRLLQLYGESVCADGAGALAMQHRGEVEAGTADRQVLAESRSGASASCTRCTSLDAVELVLRLALRKPIAFAATRLEQQYGDFLHVQDALAVLEQTHIACASRDEDTAAQRSVPDDSGRGAGIGGASLRPLLVRWTGRAVAKALVVSSPPHASLIVAVLHAVRATELRLFALTLFHHYCGAARLSSTSASRARETHASLLLPCAAIDLPAVPTRKAAIVDYLLRRRYRQTAGVHCGSNDGDGAETGADMDDATEEAALVAVCWEAQIGDVYVVQDGVRDGVGLVARLFRVLTDTVDSACVSRRMNKLHSSSVLHGTDPRAATQLFTRTQFRVQRAGEGAAATATATGPRTARPSSLLPLPASPPTPSSSAWPSTFFYARAVTLFGDVASWTAYEDALQAYQTLYTLLNSPAAAVRQSQRHILALHRRAMDALQHDARLEDVRCTAPDAAGRADRACDARRGIAAPLYNLLRAHGLRVAYLLQFTARYRWYTCVELLCQLLQPLHRYEEANLCLHILLKEPLLCLRPTAATSTACLAMYYRVEKRGKWWHRLSQNLVHLRQKDAALGVLEAAHAGWYEASQQPPAVRAAMNELLALAGPASVAEAGVRSAAAERLVRQLPAPLQRQARLLRALWPEPGRGSAGLERAEKGEGGDGRGVVVGMAAYHAVMAYLQSGYCRRHDRVNVERTLRVLHHQQRRWTPLGARLGSFTASLRAAHVVALTGLRDSEDERLWHDPRRRFAAVDSVEGYVLHTFVHEWNAQCDVAPAGMTHCRGPATRRLVVRGDGVVASERVPVAGATAEVDASGWRGMHSEGRWVALTARVLLADCYYDDHVKAAAATEDVAEQLLWLSPLQHDPLDVDDPIAFRARRRRSIAAHLDRLAKATSDELIAYAGRHVWGGATGGGAAERAPTEARRDAAEAPQRPCDVDVGDFPLLEMMRAVPRQALCALLRCLYTSDPFDGYTPTFAGFPDLVLWRVAGGGVGGDEGDFVLVEVKGPNDTLSAKQVAMNDTLTRCGFDVRVALVRDTAPLHRPHPHTAPDSTIICDCDL